MTSVVDFRSHKKKEGVKESVLQLFVGQRNITMLH